MPGGGFSDFERVDDILARALELAPDERERFVARECGEDAALLARVHDLLQAVETSGRLRPGGALHEAVWRDVAGSPADGERFGPWRACEIIGRGGMAVVYRGERADGEFEQQVAIKLLHAPRAGAIGRRFMRERRILARLEHPNIARLLDAGTEESGRSYLVMEYVDGEPVDAYCSRRQLPIKSRLRLFLKICAAVQFAHRNLIVHRDLKPSNIMVTAEGEPKLLDFGIAKLLEPDPESGDLTQTALADRVLTPQYASPEQVLGEPVSTTTDVYALGLLLYELLTGRRARRFDTASPREIERIVCDTDPAAPSAIVSPPRLARSLKGDVDNIVLKALHREPSRRYASAEQLASDVLNHLEGRPVDARPDSLPYRVRKFVSRHAAGVATAASVLLLSAGLIAYYTTQLGRERDVARQAAARAQVEAEKAEQVAEFLMGLFEASRPEQARGEEATARELLALGVERAAALRNRPEIQARLLAVTGKTYHRLGMYDEAEVLYRQALELRERLLGPAHERVAESLSDLGVLLKDRGAYRDAEPHLRRALNMRRRVLGPEHEELAISLDEMGRLLEATGDHAGAEPYFREGLAMRRRLFGNHHRETASSINSVAHVLRQQNDLDGAEAHFREALAIYIRLFGDEHPWVGTVKNNLALVLIERRAFGEAEALLLESLNVQRRMLGEDHPDLVYPMHDLAAVYREQGRLEEAERLLVEAARMAREALGSSHPMVAALLFNRGRVYMARGDAGSAAPLFREALDIRLAALSHDDGRIAQAQGWLGWSLVGLERFDEAESLMLASYSTLERREGLSDRHAREALERIVALYEYWDRPERAEEYRARLSE